MKRTTPRIVAPLLVAGLLGSATGLEAAVVNASYQGIISSDSGLGLIGQTLQADLSYDDSVAGSANGSSFLYLNFIQSLAVTVGANTWTYDAADGFDSVFLNNDDVLVFAIGLEDRVVLGADTFSGPDLGTGSILPFTFNFSLGLQDNVPGGAPDGLASDMVLPATAPIPELFSLSPGPSANYMRFSWVVGNPEVGGTSYAISTSDVTTVIPLPATVWLLGTAVLGAPVLRRILSKRRTA